MLSFDEMLASAAAIAGLLLLLFAAEHLRRAFGRPAEFSRKTVHIGAGVFIAFAPVFIERAAPVLLITGAFTLLNIFAYATGRLKSVHGTSRRSFGTVYYPISFFILTAVFWESNPGLVTASMLILALGDGFAGIVGECPRSPTTFAVTGDRKSLEGSAAMFIASAGAVGIAAYVLPEPARLVFPDWPPLLIAGVVLSAALVATACEAASSRGLDNITAPLASAFVLWLALSAPYSAA